MVDNKYKRVLLKISGEALLGDQQFGIDPKPVEMIADEIRSIYERGVEIAVVVGGGNIFRGMKNSARLGMDQASGDYVGMLATVMNAVVLQCALKKIALNYRYQILLRGDSLNILQKTVSMVMCNYKPAANVYIEIDIDPVSLL